VDEETSDLDLSGGIEGDEADESIGESLGAEVDFLQDLGTISATEHGELPHGPVTVVLVTSRDTSETDGGVIGNVGLVRVGELKAGGPVVADDVVNLLGDLLVGKRGEVREGLEELVVSGLPDVEGSGLGDSAVRDSLEGAVLGGLGDSNLADDGSGNNRGGDGSHCEIC